MKGERERETREEGGGGGGHRFMDVEVSKKDEGLNRDLRKRLCSLCPILRHHSLSSSRVCVWTKGHLFVYLFNGKGGGGLTEAAGSTFFFGDHGIMASDCVVKKERRLIGSDACYWALIIPMESYRGGIIRV